VAASVVGQPRRWLHHSDAAGASPHERLVDLVETRAEYAERVLVADAGVTLREDHSSARVSSEGATPLN